MMIRIAKERDLSQVEEIYNELLDHEAATISYTNWHKGLYPTLACAKAAFEQNTLFVGEENGVLYGCVILNQIQPPEYANIHWNLPIDSESVMVIHTLCIRPSWAGKGKGKEFIRFCEDYARSKDWRVIRLDTYEGNIPACRLYSSIGYSYVGTTKFHFQNVIWEELKCFEKLIK
jgi:RimJ/RimL family protein N-acetyltransferase